jgi:hypothetical protein
LLLFAIAAETPTALDTFIVAFCNLWFTLWWQTT